MDVAHKQRLCSVEIYGCRPCFRSPVRKSATKFKVVAENLLLQGEIKIFKICFSLFILCVFYISPHFAPAPLFTPPGDLMAAFRAHIAAVRKIDEYLEAFYLPICAQALSCVCFTHCKPLSAWNEWQAYNLDCILMLLPYAAKRSGDSWGTVRRSRGKRWHWISRTCDSKVGERHTDTRWRQSSEFNLEPGGSKAGPTVSKWEQFLKNNKKENYSKQKLTM